MASRMGSVRKQNEKLDFLIQKQNLMEEKFSEMTTRLFMIDKLAEVQNCILGCLNDIQLQLHGVLPVIPSNASNTSPVLHQLTQHQHDSGDIIKEVKDKLDIQEQKVDLMKSQITETTQPSENLIRSTRNIEIIHTNTLFGPVDSKKENVTIKFDEICESLLKLEILTEKCTDKTLSQNAYFITEVEELLNSSISEIRKNLQDVSDVMVQRFDKINTELERYSEAVRTAEDTVNDVLQIHSDVTQTTDWRKLKEEIEQASMSITALVENIDKVENKMQSFVKGIENMEMSLNVEHTALNDHLAPKQRQDQLTTVVEHPFNEIKVMQPRNINLLLIGPAGHGKSATGNSIMRRKVFKTNVKNVLMTKTIQIEFCKFEGRIIKVVDTPHLWPIHVDKDTDAKLFTQEMEKANDAPTPGHQVVLLVVYYGFKFNQETLDKITFLRNIFGDTFFKKHCIIVFTFGDRFQLDAEKTGFSFPEWCYIQDKVFQTVLNECSNKVILFDNSTEENTIQKYQLARLIQMVDHLCIQGDNGENFKRF